MELGAADASGRRSPVDTGKTFTLDVDMVIKAAGQMPFTGLVQEEHLTNLQGKIVVKEKAATNIDGVFAGGDCVNGGKEVVDAAQAGKDGAAAILAYLGLGEYKTESAFEKVEHTNKGERNPIGFAIGSTVQ